MTRENGMAIGKSTARVYSRELCIRIPPDPPLIGTMQERRSTSSLATVNFVKTTGALLAQRPYLPMACTNWKLR